MPKSKLAVKFTAIHHRDFNTVELAVRSTDTQMERFTTSPQLTKNGVFAVVRLTKDEAQLLVDEFASVGIKAVDSAQGCQNSADRREVYYSVQEYDEKFDWWKSVGDRQVQYERAEADIKHRDQSKRYRIIEEVFACRILVDTGES